MSKPDLTIYVGFDERDLRAFVVAMRSLRAHAPKGVRVEPLLTWELRRTSSFARPTITLPNGQKMDCLEGRHQSTEFTYARFLTPHHHYSELCRDEPCAFVDPDVLCRASLGGLVDLIDPAMLVQVVTHDHRPAGDEQGKVGGLIQQTYARKNWSSLMVFPDPMRAAGVLAPRFVSTSPRDWLHGLAWAEGHNGTGVLPSRWNWLYKVEPEPRDPAIVHFTLGTPDVTAAVRDRYVDEWSEWLNCRDWP